MSARSTDSGGDDSLLRARVGRTHEHVYTPLGGNRFQ